MQVYFKLRLFPQISQTFIVSNLVYAKENGFKIDILVNEYLGLENSSQKQLLKDYNIQDDLVKPFRFSHNIFLKTYQVIIALCNLRVLTNVYRYYKLRRKKNLQPLAELLQFKNFRSGLVHVHFNNALQPLIELSKIGYINPKCVITFHGYDAFLDSKDQFQKKYSEFYKKHVVAVTTNSNYLKNIVCSLGVDTSIIKVVPIGINSSLFKGQPKQISKTKTIKLITVGRLVQLKGHIYAINVVSQLLNQGYKVEYSIIGEGDSLEVLKNEVSRLKVTEYVFFEGAKQQDDIVRYMQETDVFILPSTYDDNVKRREAFGVVSIEAQAMGLPVVGFNSGGFPDTVINGETGFVVEDRNVDLLTKKIKLLIDNPELYKNMSKKALEHAKKFDMKHTTQHYLDLYKQFNV